MATNNVLDFLARKGVAVDQGREPPDNDGMEARLTKDLLDARLEATEARIETRIVSIEHSLAAIAKGQEEAIESGKSTRHVIIATGVAVVLGIAAFNATVLSNMVASFESGKNTAAMLSSAEKSITEATRALEAAAAKAGAQVAPAPGAAPAN